MIAVVLSLALAQEEACVPAKTTALTTLVEKSEGALNSMDASGAGAALDEAAEAARCLDVPIPKPLLARVAWGRAELAAADMDEEVAWNWIRLAQEAGVATPPDRVPPNHPVRRVFADTRDPLPISGPEGVRLYTPKKGSIYADGAVLEAPMVRVSTPHLIQVFDKDGAPYLGTWQNGAAFPSNLLVPLVSEGNRTRRSVEAGDELPPKNWKPKKIGTEAAYKEWIKKHPEGPWLQDAKDGIDDLDWAIALKTGTDLAMRQYIHDHKDGLHVDEAAFFIEDLKYREVVKAPTREEWVAFVEEYPDGTYGAEARVQVEIMDWDEARTADTSAAYTKYLERQPDGRNRDVAVAREEERALDEARTRGDTALERYLERWPSGTFADEARAILGSVEFAAVTIEVTGEVDAPVIEKVKTDLLAELEKRELPVLEEGEDPASAGRIAIDLSIVPGDKITEIGAHFRLQYQELKRPLNEFVIDSKVLPTADVGAQLGEMLVANLHPMKRWLPPDPEDEKAAPE